MIGNRQKIKWSKVISDSLLFQLAHIGSSKRFYMNFYLVFLLLHGRNRKSAHADIEVLNNPEKVVWRSYSKCWLESRWDYYAIRNDGWEYQIYKEIKGKQMVKRISNSTIEAICRHANYFLEDPAHTYIWVYGSEVKSYLLPRYASNCLILMEFCRQLLLLYENVWKKKNATTNLPISVGEYTCSTWQEAKEMGIELSYYHFGEEEVASHYDPEGRIQCFYRRTFRNPIVYEL